MAKSKSEPTALDQAWTDVPELLRAYRKRPNAQNRQALDAALDGYRREYLRDFEIGGGEGDGGSAAGPAKLKAA